MIKSFIYSLNHIILIMKRRTLSQSLDERSFLQKTWDTIRKPFIYASLVTAGLFSVVGAETSTCGFQFPGGTPRNPQFEDICAQEYADKDNDGFYAIEECGTAVDCDDDPADDPEICLEITSLEDCTNINYSSCATCINPEAQEVCDLVDNNCREGINENLINIFYRDADGDGFGNPSDNVEDCALPAGYVEIAGDCDDTNFLINPSVSESCNLPAIDDNCNTYVNENCSCINGTELPCGWTDEGNCDYGRQNCVEGSWTACDAVFPIREICGNEVDDDCDGSIDEESLYSWCRDADGDGFGNPNNILLACDGVVPQGYLLDNCTDCDDNPTNDTEEYKAAEHWRLLPFFVDADGDGDGSNEVVYECIGNSLNVPNRTLNNLDCNDINNRIYTRARESCDGIDNDCDGATDSADPDLLPIQNTIGRGVCAEAGVEVTCPDGEWVLNYSTVPLTYEAEETSCDGLDNDCDGVVDQMAPVWYLDFDGDGFGDLNTPQQSCLQPANYVSNSNDCDDQNPFNSPKGIERCDGEDNNCDNHTDEDDVCLDIENIIAFPCMVEGVSGICTANPNIPDTKNNNWRSYSSYSVSRRTLDSFCLQRRSTIL